MTTLVFKETEIKNKIEEQNPYLKVLDMRLDKRDIKGKLKEDYYVTYRCLHMDCKYEGTTRHDHLLYDRPIKSKGPLGCSGCKKKYGFDPSLPATLYAIRFLNVDPVEFNKTGITNYDVKQRFKGFPEYEILHTLYFENGQDAKDKEQEILKALKRKGRMYTPINSLPNGNTECFI